MAGEKRVLGTFLALCLAYYWSLRSRGGRPLIAPPYCAWRFISNFDAWNVALPDANSVYHVTFMYMNEGDVLRINGSFPYSRYFSFQTYNFPDFLPRGSLRDFEIVPREGVNLYSNTSAAVRGMPQGQYTMHITAHGNENRTNELGALPMHWESGFFSVFMRIYELERSPDVNAPPYHPDADLSCFAPGGAYEKENPAEWGWACPPVVEVRRKDWANGEFQTIPMCTYRRKRGFKGYNDRTKPVVSCGEDWGYNKEDNFALPLKIHVNGKFSNKDARYLLGCGIATPNVTKGDQHEYWARVQGILPRTPGSLYQAPLVANHSDYDIRYVSVSSGSRSVPYPTYATLNDRQISRFYEKELGADWDRSFVIWVGPNDAEMPAQARKEKAMYLPWGKSFNGENLPYPALLYRQILAKSQVTRSYFPPEDTSGLGGSYRRFAVAEVLPEVCTRAGNLNTSTSTSQGSCDAQSQEDRELGLKFKTVCCGSEAPDWCHDPPLVKYRLREHYPRVQYYLRATGTEDLVVAPTLDIDG